VIETIVKEAPVLQYLPFMEVTGTSVRYAREATMPAAAFYAPLGTWTEAAPTFTQHIAYLSILGTDADVDNFLQAAYADTNDLEAEVIALRAKAVAHKFAETFVIGDTGTDANSFDGVRELCATGQTLSMGTNGGALTFDKLDELIDTVKPGKPELLVMSRRSRRKLKSLRRADGISFETHLSEFGQMVETYDGIPIVIDDFMPDTETQGTSGAVCSSIYAMKLGMSTGLMGLQHGGITVETVGELETKDATRHRIKWYSGLALMSELGLARLQGITA
jgi:HK97 family phage major capsid protein